MSTEEEVQRAVEYKRHTIEGYDAGVRRDKRDEPQLSDLATDHNSPIDSDTSLQPGHVTSQTTPPAEHTL